MSGTRDGLDPIPGEEWWACETNVPIFSLLGVGSGQNSIQIQNFTDFYPFHRRGLVGHVVVKCSARVPLVEGGGYSQSWGFSGTFSLQLLLI